MAEIQKGLISTLVSKYEATAVICNAPGAVSCTLTIPFFLVDCLEVGMPVAFVEFDDCTGVVLARMDGEWNHDLEGSVNVQENVTTTDLITGVAGFNGHTHTGVHGETGTPN